MFRGLGVRETQRLPFKMSEYTYPLKHSKRREPRQQEPMQPNGAASQAFNGRHAIVKRGRFWEVIDPLGTLVCVTVYKCGAREVIRRLESKATDSNTVQP